MIELSPFILTVIGNSIIAIGIIVTVYLVKYIKERLLYFLEYITATTVGIILALVFLGFLPEQIGNGFNAETMGAYILGGIILFYLFELFLHWHHCKDLDHNSNCIASHTHDHKNGALMFGATMLHNSFHGIVLFGAFSINFSFGVATTFGLLLHAIPQNVTNYIMNHNNIKYSYFAAVGGLLGAILTYPFADFLLTKEGYVISIISGGLLYTALADIFPEFKGNGSYRKKIMYVFFIIVGICIFLGFEKLGEGII